MGYVGFGQITDPMDPLVQAPILPSWMGRGDPATLRVQGEISKSIALLDVLRQGGPAIGAPYSDAVAQIAVPPGASAADRAALMFARSWIFSMTNAQIQALNPTLPADVIEQARTMLWVPGVEPSVYHAQAVARFQEELPVLEEWAAEVSVMLAELARYMDFVEGTFKQFNTYMNWMAHHLRKKAHRTANVNRALTVVGEVAKWIPVVGWVVYLAVIVVQVGVQVQAARGAAEELNRAGFRGYILMGAANIYEATTQSMATADNLYGQLQIAIAIREDYLTGANAVLPPAKPGGVRSQRGRLGLWLGGGVAAAAAAALMLMRR